MRLGIGLTLLLHMHRADASKNAEETDNCCWSWQGVHRGFAIRGLNPEFFSDGAGGETIGMQATFDTARGHSVLNIPAACLIVSQEFLELEVIKLMERLHKLIKVFLLHFPARQFVGDSTNFLG